MRKVIVIAYYFPPLGWSGVQRTLKFVKYLKEFGWEPIVVTVGETTFSIIDESLRREIPDGLKIVRIDDMKLKNFTDRIKVEAKEYVKATLDIINDSNLLNRYEAEIEKTLETLRNLLLLPDGNAIWANNIINKIADIVNIEDIDLVYTTSGPYSAHLVGFYLKFNFKLPWVVDFRDEWTNNPYLSYTNKLRHDLEKHMEENILINCNKIVTISDVAKNNYIKKFNVNKDKIQVITNGYDEEDFQKNIKKETSSKFTIVHNGTCHFDVNPCTIIEAISNLIAVNKVNKESVEIRLIGKVDNNIRLEIQSKDIHTIVKLVGYLPHIKSLNESAKGNLLLLITGKREEVKSVYTGKVFEYLRLKKPILALTPKDSVIEKLLEETSCGINAEYDDIESIENIIFKYYSDWKDNKKFIVNENEIKKYERKNLTRKLAKLFDDVLSDN